MNPTRLSPESLPTMTSKYLSEGKVVDHYLRWEVGAPEAEPGCARLDTIWRWMTNEEKARMG